MSHSEIELTRINNDTYGNPRYVVHFFALLNETDRKTPPQKGDIFGIDTLYALALRKAKKIGGRKYHTKQFGGGIVFQSYNTDRLKESIAEVQQAK